MKQMEKKRFMHTVSNIQAWNKFISALLNCLFFFYILTNHIKAFTIHLYLERDLPFYFNFLLFNFHFLNIILLKKLKWMNY